MRPSMCAPKPVLISLSHGRAYFRLDTIRLDELRTALAELIPSPLTGKAEARFAGKSYSEAAAAVMYLPPATEA